MANGQWKNRILGSDEVAPDDLLANPLNWRVHPKHQQDALKGVIDEVGFVSPVLVQAGTDVVVDGHMRVTLALRDNIATIPVIYLDLDDNEVNTILATFDPLSALAATDAAQLDALLREVSTSDAAVMQMLADLAEEAGVVSFDGENDGMTDADDVPEPPVDPITRPGDLWTLGRHRLLCGDSTNRADVDRLMQGERAGMVFTDPPYGIDFQSNHRKATPQFNKIANDAVVLDVAQIIYEVSAENCAAYICTRWDVYAQWAEQFSRFDIKNCVVWFKRGGGMGDLDNAYSPNHEFIIVAHKGRAPLRAKRHADVWEIARDSVNEYQHPTQKPVELSAFAIQNHSDQGAIVLDLFGGSGSTLIACEQTNRSCRMMELDPIYCDVIVRRWEQFTGETASREATD